MTTHENGTPITPDWMAQARPAIERLESRCRDGCPESAIPLSVWLQLTTNEARPLCRQQLDGRGDQ